MKEAEDKNIELEKNLKEKDVEIKKINQEYQNLLEDVKELNSKIKDLQLDKYVDKKTGKVNFEEVKKNKLLNEIVNKFTQQFMKEDGTIDTDKVKKDEGLMKIVNAFSKSLKESSYSWDKYLVEGVCAGGGAILGGALGSLAFGPVGIIVCAALVSAVAGGVVRSY